MIVILVGVSNSSGKHKLDNDEMIAYTSLNRAITHSSVDGTGTIIRTEFDNVGKMLKNIDTKNQWFSGAITYYGLYTKTSDGFITQVTDGNDVATFTMEYDIFYRHADIHVNKALICMKKNIFKVKQKDVFLIQVHIAQWMNSVIIFTCHLISYLLHDESISNLFSQLFLNTLKYPQSLCHTHNVQALLLCTFSAIPSTSMWSSLP